MTGRSATATVSSPVSARSQDPAGAGTVVVLIPAPWSVVPAAAAADLGDRFLAGHRVGGGDRRYPGPARGRHGAGYRGSRLAGRRACRRPGHPGSARGRDRVGGRGGAMAGRGSGLGRPAVRCPGLGRPAVRCPGPGGRGGRRPATGALAAGTAAGIVPRASATTAAPVPTISAAADQFDIRRAWPMPSRRAPRGPSQPPLLSQSPLSRSPEFSRRPCPGPPRPGSGTRPAG